MTKNYTLTKEWQKIELTATGGSSFLIRKTGANDCIVYIAENDSDFENAIILTEPIALNLTENRFIYAKASIDGAMINITNFFYDVISGDVTTPAITTATLTLSNENLNLPAFKAEDITITAEVASNWDFKVDDESIASAKRLSDTKLRITALKAGATSISVIAKVDGKLNNVKKISLTATKRKFIVVGVAGGSNSVGYDESNHNAQYDNTTPDRIVQLGYYNDDNLRVMPLSQVAQNLQNMSDIADSISIAGHFGKQHKGTKGIHLPLAKELLKYIPSDYSVLVVPVAFGTTGFASGNIISYNETTLKPSINPQHGRWSLNNGYYQTLRDRVKYALDLDKDNKFLGVVWCLGEQDNDNNLETLKKGFQTLVEQLATDWQNYKDRTLNRKVDKSIWYVYETAPFWRANCNLIWKWYREYLGDSNYAVVAPRDYYTNATNGAPSGAQNGSTSNNTNSHYGNDAYINVVAPNVVDLLVRNKAIYGLGNQTTNFVGNKQYVDKYWNPYINTIEVNDRDNSVTFVRAVSNTTPTAVSFTLKESVKEVTFTNIAGAIILLEHTAKGDYSGLFFNRQNAGSANDNYTTVRGMGKLDIGLWDSNTFPNDVNVPQRNFTSGRTKIKQISRGVYQFYFNDAEWFKIDLLNDKSSLKSNGVNEGEIVYSIGLMYGWTRGHNTQVLAQMTIA